MATGLDELLAPYRANLFPGDGDAESPPPVYRLALPTFLASQMREPGNSGSLDDLIKRGHPEATSNVESLVKRMAARKYGWTGDQWSALHDLIMKESGFNPRADNPTSSAYGIFQFLDSTRENYGLPLKAGPRGQTRAGLKYIMDRYGSPKNALNFHLANNWY